MYVQSTLLRLATALAKEADEAIFKSIANAACGVDNAGASLPQADSTPNFR